MEICLVMNNELYSDKTMLLLIVISKLCILTASKSIQIRISCFVKLFKYFHLKTAMTTFLQLVIHDSLTPTSTEETLLLNFLEFRKRLLQNFLFGTIYRMLCRVISDVNFPTTSLVCYL